MKRRPLCIFCVLFLTVQAIRVLFFGAGDYTSALGQIVNRNNKGEINLILTGTADRIDEKESVTAVRVKGNAVSFYSGSDRKIARQSVFGKSDGHRSSYDFSQELPRKIWEEKVLVYLEKEDAAHIKIGNKLKIKASISNANIFRNIKNEYGSFYNYLKLFTKEKIIYETGKTTNELSDAISKDLKKRGMKFVGSTIIYSYLQAIGIINSHDKDCFFYRNY